MRTQLDEILINKNTYQGLCKAYTKTGTI